MVLDEPASNIDPGAIRLLAMVIAERKRQGKTIVIAEHRLTYLRKEADRVIYMEEGEIVFDFCRASANPDGIFAHGDCAPQR